MTARDGKDILRVHDDEPKSRCFVHCVANSLESRLWFHANGSGRSFTTRYKIDRLVYYEDYDNPEEAIQREKEIKHWRRQKKNELVETVNPPGTIYLTNCLGMKSKAFFRKQIVKSLIR